MAVLPLYGHAKWRKLRRAFLRTNQLCVFCAARGMTVAAEVVDHREPHHGNAEKFWRDAYNGDLLALCKPCNDSVKRERELKAWSHEIGADGLPLNKLILFGRAGKVS